MTSPYGHPQGQMDQTTRVWALNLEGNFDLKLAVGFATADLAVLFTVPADKRVLLEQLFWEIVTGFTGGTSSAIGISSSRSPHNTAGDLLGGASGDVAAALVAGVTQGTIGASFSAAPKTVVLEAGDTILYNRITSAFAAGAGYVHVVGRVIT